MAEEKGVMNQDTGMSKERKVRLADIAQKFGVSTVTVHNALCGRKGVSDEMRAKIVAAAKELGYEAGTASGKKRISNESWKIGVIIAETYLAQYATYYWKMYQELALMAAEKRCYTIIEVLKKEAETETFEIPEAIRETSVDGMIVIGEIDKRYIQKLKNYTKLPIIFLDFYDSEIAKDCVIADNFYGMYQMTELLFGQGMDQLAFVGSVYATSSIMDRYCGFMKSLMEHHQALPDEWLIEDRDETGHIEVELPRCMPQAFACNCDQTAGILIAKLEKEGYRVPEDISVIGFDNFMIPGYSDTKVTTYEVDMKAMTKIALDKIIKQIQTPGRSRSMSIVPGHIRWKNSVKIS